MVKNLPANVRAARNVGSIPGSGRSPGERNGNPLQYSWLKNPTDRGAWQAIVHRVAKSQTWLKQLSRHIRIQFSSVQFSRSVVSDSLPPHELQHSRPPCPPPTPRVYSNSCPLNQWCHPNISPSVISFSSCPQSLPASGSFPMSQFFTSRATYWSFSFSISPSNEYSELISFRMDWLDLLALGL